MTAHSEAIRGELEALKVDGVIRPADVVERARDPESAMHGWFEWDESAAAQEFRLYQARKLLRVHVTVEQREDSPTRAFVSLSSDRKVEGGGYRALDDVMSDEALRAQLLRDALAELRCAQQKYRHLKQLSGVWKAVEEAEGQNELSKAA